MDEKGSGDEPPPTPPHRGILSTLIFSLLVVTVIIDSTQRITQRVTWGGDRTGGKGEMPGSREDILAVSILPTCAATFAYDPFL